MGWTISGLPMISRSGKSMYYDGKSQGVIMDNSDSFLLNGIRLIKTERTNAYIQYESEQGNIKVVGYINMKENLMKYFEVYYPDGTKGIFGSTSRTHNYLFYPMISLTDLNGNKISYTYSYSNNHFNIKNISYNNVSVEFKYTTRQDPLLSYSGGLKINGSELLESIVCKLKGVALGTYKLSYLTRNSVSLLKQVDYIASEKSYNPLCFYYGDGQTVSFYTNSNTNLLEHYVAETPNNIKLLKGRFDYDNGSEGLICLPNLNPYWKHHRHHTAFRHSQKRFDNLFTGDEKIFLFTNLKDRMVAPVRNLLTEKGFVDILCMDIEGNREECVVKINNSVVNNTDQITFAVYNTHYMGIPLNYTRTYNFSTVYTDADGGKSIQPKFYYTGDFNGDGKMEVLAVSVHQPFGDTNKPSICYIFDLANDRILYQDHLLAYNVEFLGTDQTDPEEAMNKTDRLMVMDYDGDGKTDICHINENGTNIYTFDVVKDVLTARKVATYTNLKKTNLINRDVILGEFNGDGLMDLLLSPPNTSTNDNLWFMYNSKGNGEFDYSSFVGPYNSNADDNGFIVQDVNGDGKTDLIKYDTDGFYTYLVSNNKVGNDIFYTKFPSSKSIIVPANINTCNNSTQLVSLNKDIVTKYSFSRDDGKDVMVTGMINSFGVVEKNEYRFINDDRGGLYTQGSNAVFPYVNILEPLPVIASSETYINGNRIENDRFQYKNAVFHQQGLGFCGFEMMGICDKREQFTNKTYSPYRYCVLTKEESPTYERSYTYDIKTLSNKIARIRLKAKVETDLLKNVSATTSYEYDDYGYPTEESTSYTGNITVHKSNTYSSNPEVDDGYNLGFLTNQLVTVTRDGSSYTERMCLLDYSSRLRLFNVRAYYKNGKQVEVQTYQYDRYGNPISEIVKKYTSSDELKTVYEYDSNGRIYAITSPMELTKKFWYDMFGRLLVIEDHKKNLTRFDYDSFGRKISVTYPDGTTEKIQYAWSSTGPDGLYSITRINTDQRSTIDVYDALNREVRNSEIRFDGSVISIDKLYDSYGNLEKVSLPFTGKAASLWNTYAYDAYDRILSCTEASGKKTVYSYKENTVTTVADNISVTKEYDAQDNLISVKDSAGTVTYNLSADGQLSSIVAPGNVVTSFGYDEYRRQTSLVDPSWGTISYEYDAAGNLAKEKYPDGDIIQNEYDSYNRVVKTITPEFVTSYEYNDIGELTGISTDNGTSKSFSYDVYGRLTVCKENAVDGKWLQKEYTYADGNVNTIKYRTLSGVLATENYIYSNGYLSEAKLNGTTTVFKLSKENSFRQPTEVVTGRITRKYDFTAYGFPSGRSANGQSVGLQNFSYVFDVTTSNLSSRKDMTRGLTEKFGYDNLNRLTSYADKVTQYDVKGNITCKSDIGTFEYTFPQKPYAVSGMTLSGSDVPLVCNQKVTYASFMRPISICYDNCTATFNYNGEYERVKMNLSRNGDNILTRYYLGNCYELDQTSYSSKEKLYLFGDYYNAAAVYVKDESSSGVYYILRDYLGSITHVVASDGTVVQELSYDAWGRLRNPVTQQVYQQGQEPELFLGRGYTGHEHLVLFGLINMNARLYDPVLGRLLSPDPYIQMPEMSQNFNRYTYAMNNPLKYNDPDGEFFLFTIFNAVTDFVGNIFNHGFNVSQYNWKRTVNSWKIDMGMFRGNVWQILNKWTWGGVNSLIGNLVSEGYNTVGYVDGVTSLDGMLALSGATSGGRAFTIGHYSLGPDNYKADWRDHLFVHEYGHYIQSQQWGYFYIPVIAIPSVISAAHFLGEEHKYKWYEVNASKLGAEYFDKKYGRGADGYVEGDKNYFDIVSFSGKKWQSPYKNPRNGKQNENNSFPITGSHGSCSDYIIPGVSMGFPLLFVF